MNIEKIFSKISCFKNICLDTILFESKYPVMFTCKNDNDIFLFICCLVNSNCVKWIGTKTDYDILIGLLENRITIRNAFMSVTNEKIIIEYNGEDVSYSTVNSDDMDRDLLPTAGEYMDAEGDEYEQELADFKFRNKNIEYTIKPVINDYIFFCCFSKSVELPEDCYIKDVEDDYEIKFSVGIIQDNSIIELL